MRVGLRDFTDPPVRLANLVEDNFPGQDVAFLVAQRPVESAKAAIFRAEVGVVDIAIDDVGDYAFGMEAATDGVSLEAQPNEIGGVEVIEGLGAGERQGFSLQRTEPSF